MFGNLQALAATAVPQQQLKLIKFTGNVTNDAGYDVPSYADPVDITGSIQPMSADTAARLGLDFRETRAVLYTSADIALAKEGTQPDRVEYGGKLYDAVSITDWRHQDDWAHFMLVAV